MSTQSTSRYLIETPPYCPTVECYQHGNGQEHHVEGCPMATTLYSSMHTLDHACRDAGDAIRPFLESLTAELRKSWRGRVTLLLLRLKAAWRR